MQMERRPALMGPQMSRDHPATRAAGAAAAPEVTPERLINCSGVLLLQVQCYYMLSKLYVVPFLLACPTSLPLPPPLFPPLPLPSSLPPFPSLEIWGSNCSGLPVPPPWEMCLAAFLSEVR
jgi:hypothetical protein